MFWNLSMMIVTLKFKTQLPFMKLHTLFVRKFGTLTTLPILMHLCCLVRILVKLYDNALDDGPMLIHNPPCLHEDRNDILVIHDDALSHPKILECEKNK
jgi:hypothetical protein